MARQPSRHDEESMLETISAPIPWPASQGSPSGWRLLLSPLEMQQPPALSLEPADAQQPRSRPWCVQSQFLILSHTFVFSPFRPACWTCYLPSQADGHPSGLVTCSGTRTSVVAVVCRNSGIHKEAAAGQSCSGREDAVPGEGLTARRPAATVNQEYKRSATRHLLVRHSMP